MYRNLGRPIGRPFPFQEHNMTNPKTPAEILYGNLQDEIGRLSSV
jgi:hypothetical protein